jgi:hypothetical protein
VANYDRGPLHAAVSYASTQNTTDLDSARRSASTTTAP